MNGSDKNPEDRIGSTGIIEKHDNRLGAVYECVKQFIDMRCGLDGSAFTENDIMSFVLFDSDTRIAMENQKFAYSEELINTLCNYKASGGTRLGKAMKVVGDLV